MYRLASVGLVAWMTGCASAPTAPPGHPPSTPGVVTQSTSAPREQQPAVQESPVVAEDNGAGLTNEQVSEVLVTRSLAVGGCHAVEYSGRSPEPGFVVVDLAIQRDGHVRSARVVDSSYQQPSLPQCVASVTRELNFPPASGDTEVEWRFDFKGR